MIKHHDRVPIPKNIWILQARLVLIIHSLFVLRRFASGHTSSMLKVYKMLHISSLVLGRIRQTGSNVLADNRWTTIREEINMKVVWGCGRLGNHFAERYSGWWPRNHTWFVARQTYSLLNTRKQNHQSSHEHNTQRRTHWHILSWSHWVSQAHMFSHWNTLSTPIGKQSQSCQLREMVNRVFESFCQVFPGCVIPEERDKL